MAQLCANDAKNFNQNLDFRKNNCKEKYAIILTFSHIEFFVKTIYIFI